MQRKLTKILATISSNNCSEQLLTELHNAGMDAVRLNTAHMTTEDALRVVRQIRTMSDRIGILIDTKGPEVRTREIEKPILLKTGETVCIVRSAPTGKAFCVSYPQFVDEVPNGAVILIEDGTIELEVVQKNQDELVCITKNAGQIAAKKNVNVPAVRLNLPSLSDRDEEFIRFAARYELDFIAHSFVRTTKAAR